MIVALNVLKILMAQDNMQESILSTTEFLTILVPLAIVFLNR